MVVTDGRTAFPFRPSIRSCTTWRGGEKCEQYFSSILDAFYRPNVLLRFAISRRDARNVTHAYAIPLLQRRPRNRACEPTKIFGVCAMPNRPSKLACDISATAETNDSPCGG